MTRLHNALSFTQWATIIADALTHSDAEIDERIRHYHDVACIYQRRVKELEAVLREIRTSYTDDATPLLRQIINGVLEK